VLLPSRKVLVLEDPCHCHLTSSPCPSPLTTKFLKIVEDSTFCERSVMYQMKSISSVTATVHEVIVKNGLLIDLRLLLIDMYQ